MSTTDQLLLALEAYREVQAEALPSQGEPAQTVEIPHAEQAVPDPGPLPGGSLLLGIADDGLPLLLDLHDAGPGPLLVSGDEGCGKTAFLHTLARSLDNHPEAGDFQFAALTNFPEEWTAEENLPSCLGIWPAFHPSAVEFLDRMVAWAEALPRGEQMVLLLVDDLDLMTNLNAKTRHDLRWLLRHGPERHIWPAVTMSARRIDENVSWADAFHTFILGRTDQLHSTQILLGDHLPDLSALAAGSQFTIKLAEGWLRFRIPAEKGVSE